MHASDKIIALGSGSKELEALRNAATAGSAGALKTYVYWCSWQGIRADKFIPFDKKRAVFKALLEADLFEVVIDG